MAVLDPSLEPASMKKPLTNELGELAAALAKAGKFVCNYSSDEACNYCPPRIHHAIVVIVREALTNIVKHANAELVSIRLERDSQSFMIAIEDDGKGFDPDTSDTGRGLSGMYERAERAGGVLSIDSALGKGTRIRMTIPVS